MHALLGYAYARAGKVAEARAVGAQLRRLTSEGYVSGYVLALYHLGLGERAQALDQLERAYDDRSWLVIMMTWIRSSTLCERIHDFRRFCGG